jgi:hypothetical protein
MRDERTVARLGAGLTTSLLTVLCVALVHRERPDWLGIGEAACAAALSPERVSRLASRVARPFADIVDTFIRRGRPVCIDDPVRAELMTLRALLSVASSALALVPLRRPAVRALLVGAWQRLSTELPSVTGTVFCRALSLPERTLRHWLAHPPVAHTTTPPAPPSPPTPPPARPPRRPRFRFDVFLPGTQVGADTTDLSVFGVPLKLVGVQDIGGRDRSLFDSVVIDTRFVELYRRYPVQILRSAEASLCNRFLMRGAPDVRAVDRYFAAIVRNHFAEHRSRRATPDASRTLQERLRQQRHEADHAGRARSADLPSGYGRLSTSSPCNGSPPTIACCSRATASASDGCAAPSTFCSAVTVAPRPTTSPPDCSDSSDSPPCPRSETTASMPSPSCSNANSPGPTLDTNLTLRTTPPALYRAPSGFLRARPLQIVCGFNRQDVEDHDTRTQGAGWPRTGC